MSRAERRIVAVMVAAFVALACAYSLIPVFEGQDEPEHYAFIHTLAATGQLPNRMDTTHWEYHQAPLYYALAVPIKLLLPDPDFEQIYRRRLMDAPPTQNVYVNMVNFQAHGPAEDFPYTASPTALAVHLLRLYSIALAAGTVLACYGIFRLFWPDRPEMRLMALGFVCFWPQFLAVSAWINNDNLYNLLTTLALLVMLVILRRGMTARNTALLGAVIGAALLTKVSALFLAAPVGVLFLFEGRRGWRYAPLVAGVAFAIAGWWYVRNAILYNDPLGTQAQYAALPMVIRDPWTKSPAANLAQAWAPLSKVWLSFGFYTNIQVPWVFQVVFVAWLALGLIGAARIAWGWRARPPGEPRLVLAQKQAILMAVYAGVLVVAVCGFALVNQYGVQGRYLYPALAIMAGLLALGLEVWAPARLRLRAALAAAVVSAGLALAALLGWYLPAYAIQPAPARIAHPTDLRYGSAVSLAGTGAAQIEAHPGQTLQLTLYWRALAATPDNLYFALHTSGQTLFALEAIPANGKLLSTSWEPGQSWAETYTVTMNPEARPGTYHVYVLVFNTASKAVLPITDSAGSPVRQPVALDIVVQ